MLKTALAGVCLAVIGFTVGYYAQPTPTPCPVCQACPVAVVTAPVTPPPPLPTNTAASERTIKELRSNLAAKPTTVTVIKRVPVAVEGARPSADCLGDADLRLLRQAQQSTGVGQ